MTLAIANATIIDATGAKPLRDYTIVSDRGRIVSICPAGDPLPDDCTVIDGSGKFVIPGLMNANVHLFGFSSRLEILARHEGRYEDIIIESAQIALKNGLTTVFDTYGPRRHLVSVRDRINAGEVLGSRFFCAGNIIGFDGPLSIDFNFKAGEVASSGFARRINATWVENSGRHLMWLSPEDVAAEVGDYLSRGSDFIKYGSNEHFAASAGAFLCFSPRVQAAMVDAAHKAGITAQAHSMSIEGLHIAVEAGCDLVTHCNVTGPVPIPTSTLDLMAKRQTGAVIFPWNEKGLAWIKQNVTDLEWMLWRSTSENARNLIKSGAPLLLANDGLIFDHDTLTDPRFAKMWSSAPEPDSLIHLGSGHFYWLRAMEEMDCPAMDMLQAATRNIAVAYGKGADLGTLEVGKIADMLVLDKDPLADARNYETIAAVIKEGVVVDRDALPQNPILTRPPEPAPEEEAYFREAISSGPRLPSCPLCVH